MISKCFINLTKQTLQWKWKWFEDILLKLIDESCKRFPKTSIHTNNEN